MSRGRPGLLELRLRNYKSIRGAILELEPLTILVGPNGAGKSNTLDALRLLADAMTLQLRGALDARGGLEMVRHRRPGAGRPPTFGIAVHMRIASPPYSSRSILVHYGFEAKATANHQFVITRERCHIEVPEHWRKALALEQASLSFDRKEQATSLRLPKGFPIREPRLEPHALLLPVLSGYPLFSEVRDALASFRHYSISPHVVRRLHEFSPGNELAPDGSNIASVIEEMENSRPQDYKRLREFLGKVVPGVTSVQAVKYGHMRGLQFTQEVGSKGKMITLEAPSMSDGTLRVLGILAAVFQRARRYLIIAVEEPEATIHPGALGVLMDILRQKEDRCQMVITTHSPDILDIQDLDPESIRLVQWSDRGTSVSRIGAASADVLRARLSTVGELLRSNFLQPAEYAGSPGMDLFPAIQETSG